MTDSTPTPPNGVIDQYTPELVFTVGIAAIVFGVNYPEIPGVSVFAVVGLIVSAAAIWTRIGVGYSFNHGVNQ